MLDLKSLPLPTADEEIWRYSRIDLLQPERFTPSPARTDIIDPHGVCSTTATSSAVASPDVFAALNAESMNEVRIDVRAGTTLEAPIIITHHIDAGTAALPRTIVEMGRDAEATVVERFVSAASGVALCVPVLSAHLDDAARLRYLAVNDLDTEAWQIGHQLAEQGRDTSLLLSTVTLGGYYTRARTEARALGSGSQSRQVALYFAAGDQMHDFRVIQSHEAPHTSSDLLFKGAVQDHARSVYTGLISIDENARQTSAHQTNRNLTLSEGAWAESVPNLDIRTNDVSCSHASTVGPIDAEQRFYLESRGVPPEVAERLVVLGFFDEVIDRLPRVDIVDAVRRRVVERLNIASEEVRS